MFFQKSVLENFALFTGKRCFGLNLFFLKKAAGLEASNTGVFL